MRRRHLLAGGISLWAAGCGRQTSDQGRVLLLKDTLPARTLAQVAQQSGIPLQPRLVASRQQGWEQVQQGSLASLALVGGDWLDPAALQPLPQAWLNTPWWQALEPDWQQVVTQSGRVWGIPWRWGTTAIGYRRDLVPFPVQTWEDLWRPELRRHLTVPDHPQEVLALVQRVLKTTAIDHPEVLSRLQALHEQVLLYTSQDYLPMLRTGDAWVAVGWSQDLYQAQRVDRRIAVVVLPSLIWWDAWVLPKGATGDPEPWLAALHAPEVIEKAVQTSRINAVTALGGAAQGEAPWLIPTAIRAASVLSTPLTLEERQAYWQLWQQVRLS